MRKTFATYGDCHPGEGRDPSLAAGVMGMAWAPAFAGVTKEVK